MRGNIRVYCRVRPFLEGEDPNNIIEILNESTVRLLTPKINWKSNNTQKEQDFNFEYIFGQKDSQKEVFDELDQLIQNTMNGEKVCLFAYGQTGSGKTYTMDGIIKNSVNAILEEIAKAKEFHWDFRIFIKLKELYNERIKDLVSGSTGETDKEYEVSEEDEIVSLLRQGLENRKVGVTKCNEHSSRSHLIFTIILRGFKGLK